MNHIYGFFVLPEHVVFWLFIFVAACLLAYFAITYRPFQVFFQRLLDFRQPLQKETTTIAPRPTASPPQWNFTKFLSELSFFKAPVESKRILLRLLRFLRDSNNGVDYSEHFAVTKSGGISFHSSHMTKQQRQMLLKLLVEEWKEINSLKFRWSLKPNQNAPRGCDFCFHVFSGSTELLKAPPAYLEIAKTLFEAAEHVGNEMANFTASQSNKDPLSFEVRTIPEIRSAELRVWPNAGRTFPHLSYFNVREVLEIILGKQPSLGLRLASLSQEKKAVVILLDYKF